MADMTVKVTCVTVDDNHLDGCECITEIGCEKTSGDKIGYSTPEQMYEFLKNDGGHAYVLNDGARAALIPVDGEHKKHVRTEPGTPDENLLNQPKCKR